jgi:hypothetical protein
MKKVYLDKTGTIFMMLQDEWGVLKEEFVVGRLFVLVATAEAGEWWR